MICDRIVVDIHDNKLSQKMLLELDLTSKKAIDLARQYESVKKQQPTVRDQDVEQVAVEAIRKKHCRQQSKNPISSSTNPAFDKIKTVPDVDSHLNMIREVVLLRIQFAIDVTRKGSSKQHADLKGKSVKCWLVVTAKVSS